MYLIQLINIVNIVNNLKILKDKYNDINKNNDSINNNINNKNKNKNLNENISVVNYPDYKKEILMKIIIILIKNLIL